MPMVGHLSWSARLGKEAITSVRTKLHPIDH